jgi:hypothetical protein
LEKKKVKMEESLLFFSLLSIFQRVKRLGLFNLTLIPRFDLMYTRILIRKIEKNKRP